MQQDKPPPPPAAGPLAGIRVIDLSTVVMGPYGSHLLADMGADVIKVEPPEGDPYRRYNPQRHTGMSAATLNLQRNKRSVVLDLKTPAARSALDSLLRTADVVLHNLRPKVIERLGYGYERVKSLNPGIVYCGAYGFGAAGPYGDKPAYDDMIQAGSGIAALYEQVHGTPQYVPSVIYDKLGGLTIAYSILAGLVQKGRTGHGTAIEVPMFESAVEFNLVEHISGAAFVPPMGPMGAQRILTDRRKPFRTQDGYVCIIPYSDRNWQDFFDFAGLADSKSDPRFATFAGRAEHAEAIYGQVEVAAAKHTTAEWIAFGDRANVPCMAVARLDELPDNPHLKAVGMFQEQDHPTEGRYLSIRPAASFAGQPHVVRHHAPTLGQHTAEVLREAGVPQDGIDTVLAQTRGAAQA